MRTTQRMLPRDSVLTRIVSITMQLLLVSVVLFTTSTTSSSTSIQQPPSKWMRVRRILPFGVRNYSNKKSYTPLLFFTVPKGMLPVCDAVEHVIRQLERECNVHVQRMDVVRHPQHEAVLHAIIQSLQQTQSSLSSSSISSSISSLNRPSNNEIIPQPPFLYHRESRQYYQVNEPPPSATASKSTPASANTKASASTQPYIDQERIRAWIKGRYLSPSIGGGQRYSNLRNTDSNSNNQHTSAPHMNMEMEETTAMDPVEALLDEMALSPEQLKGKKLMEERTNTRGK
jgi:hypothetical protein